MPYNSNSNCYCVNQASIQNIWCTTFILVWTMLSEMKWGSSWDLSVQWHSPQTMAYFLEHATPSLYVILFVCTQLLNRSTVCGWPIWQPPLFRFKDLVGVFWEHKKRFPSQFNKENWKVCACACVGVCVCVTYTNNGIKLTNVWHVGYRQILKPTYACA